LQSIQEATDADMTDRATGIGRSPRRTEDERFLTGRGLYVDDVRLEGAAHACVLRSPHAHARIVSIEAAAARGAPGVLGVLTGHDAAREGIGSYAPMPGHPSMRDVRVVRRPVLATEKVRHVGDGVALVVAETPQQAKDAAELIAVEYEILDRLRAGDEVCCRAEMGSMAAVEAAFSRAAHIARITIANPRLSANPMEPRSALASHEAATGQTTLYTSHQAPHRLKQGLAEMMGVPERNLRVISPDVGGGFGMKSNLYVEDALVVWAARRLGRPVKWIAERSESLLADSHARDRTDTGELAFDRDGRMLGIRVHVEADLGAYLSATGPVPPIQTLRLLSSVYAIPAIYGTARMYYTNTSPIAVYRGAGRPEAMHLIERLIESAAPALNIHAEEVRRRNFIAPGLMPYRTHGDLVYDSGEFAAVLDRALDCADHAGFEARRAASRASGRLRGFGVGQYIELSGQMNERMGLRMEADGTVLVFSGTHSHGQGHETVYAQMVSDWLGVPFDSVRVIQGDTDRVPGGRGTFGARSMVCGGGALRRAADEVIARASKVAALMLEAAEQDIVFESGMLRIAGSDRQLPLAAVARAAHAPVGPLAALGMGLEGVGTFDPVPTLPNGCHVAEVEIDPDTGEVRLVRYVAVDDVGVALNPMLVEGQVQGGVAQGVGQALLEQVVYEPESGQLQTGSFMDYAMPRADDLPAISVSLHNVPAKTHPLGVKGVGEAGTVGALPAVMNAALDALRPLGVDDIAMPLTSERVWRALRSR
jgi:carbon-monoxide dehydrogenase large subunit